MNDTDLIVNFIFPMVLGFITIFVCYIVIGAIAAITEIGFLETIVAMLLGFIGIGVIWVIGYTELLIVGRFVEDEEEVK